MQTIAKYRELFSVTAAKYLQVENNQKNLSLRRLKVDATFLVQPGLEKQRKKDARGYL